MAKKKSSKPKKIPKNFSLIKAIREEKEYKSNVQTRDYRIRKYIDNQYTGVATPKDVIPGQMIMFNYFEPKTEEDLEYYDAMPCTLFFGSYNSKQGPRVIGFNLHYYPPRIRYQVLDRILEIFKSFYKTSWEQPLQQEIPNIQYKMLMNQLQNAKLDFGIRQYIPNLMADIVSIPVQDWSKIVFTEGRFKKRTREAIMHYWKNWANK